MAIPVLESTGRVAIVLAIALFLRVEPADAQQTNSDGLNDLVILDPGVHERGWPAVEIKQTPDGQKIDIPPKLHVHRYFYSGDKIFQGPIMQGGPVVVVASHPKTGERLNIDAVLPPGTPRIAYTKNAINYVYPDKRVEIKFQSYPFDPCVAVVKHHNGKGVTRSVRDAGEHVRGSVKDKMSNSQLLNTVKELSVDGIDLVRGSKAAVGQFGTQGIDAAKSFAGMIPGVTYLKSLADNGPQQEYESSVQRADAVRNVHDTPFVRTNR